MVRALLDRARYVGEAVAAVVAEDKFTAYAALDLIEVDYEELPVVTDPEEAMEPGAPLVEPDWGDNIMASRDIVLGDPDAAFAEADGTISGHRAVSPDHRHGDRAARLRRLLRPLCADVSPSGTRRRTRTRCATTSPRRCGVPETSIRVIQPHVGGGFGLKMPTFQEEPLVALPLAQARAGR